MVSGEIADSGVSSLNHLPLSAGKTTVERSSHKFHKAFRSLHVRLDFDSGGLQMQVSYSHPPSTSGPSSHLCVHCSSLSFHNNVTDNKPHMCPPLFEESTGLNFSMAAKGGSLLSMYSIQTLIGVYTI